MAVALRLVETPRTEHVQIADFSDRELMAIVADLGNAVTARDVALRIFGIADLEENAEAIRHDARCVTSRFVWMRRYGLMERNDEGEWLISLEGEALRTGRLANSVERAITNAKETSGLALANVVGEKLVGAGKVSGRAMQRELQYQLNRRRQRGI